VSLAHSPTAVASRRAMDSAALGGMKPAELAAALPRPRCVNPLVPTTTDAAEEAGAEAGRSDEVEGGCGGALRSRRRRRRLSAPWIYGGEGSSSSHRPPIRIDQSGGGGRESPRAGRRVGTRRICSCRGGSRRAQPRLAASRAADPRSRPICLRRGQRVEEVAGGNEGGGGDCGGLEAAGQSKEAVGWLRRWAGGR
jgi:hypothetical protein